MTQTLQQLIMEDLNVTPVINPAAQHRTRVDAMKGLLKTSGRKGFVMSVAPEQGSVLSAYIAQTAIKELRAETGDLRYLFLALYLPEGQPDVKEANNAAALIKNFIGADEVIADDIKQSVAKTRAVFSHLPNDKGQMATRVRTAMAHGYAKDRNYMVVGAGNSSEHVLGEATLRGDAVADVQPLAGLSRHQVNQMLHFQNAPAFLLAKVPVVSDMGITFNDVDKFLGGVETEKAHEISYQFLTTQHTRRVKAPFITGLDEHLRENASRLLATV